MTEEKSNGCLVFFLGFLILGSIALTFYFADRYNYIREKFENLKAECIMKGVATYSFDANGNVIFKILEQKK